MASLYQLIPWMTRWPHAMHIAARRGRFYARTEGFVFANFPCIHPAICYNKTMPEQPLPTAIPQELHRFFWDIDADKLNPSEHPLYVINRLLDKGDLAAARWVLRNYSKGTVIDSLKCGPAMSSFSGIFWAHYFEFDPVEMPPMIHTPKVPTGLWRNA